MSWRPPPAGGPTPPPPPPPPSLPPPQLNGQANDGATRRLPPEIVPGSLPSGVPLLWCPTDGAVTGALQFRVGFADEPLYRRGITHLIEHVALHGTRDLAMQWNGFVGLNRTVFHATGPQRNVEQFLTDVSQALRQLPTDRIPAERRVLAAEARARGTTLAGELYSQRFGAKGFGTFGWWEMAIASVSADDASAWAAQWFTAQNCVVTMSAPPTPTFDLHLPKGERRSVAQPAPIVDGRAWFRHRSNCVSMLMRCERSRPAGTAFVVLLDELTRRLRDAGLCYSVNGWWERMTATTAGVTISADAVPDRERQLAEAMLDIVDELADDVPAHLLDDRRRAADSTPISNGETLYRLDQHGHDFLLGAARLTVAEEEDEWNRVSPRDLAAAIREFRADVLMQVPTGVTLARSDLPAIPPAPDLPITGQSSRYRFYYQRDDRRGRLVVGERGIRCTDNRGWTSSMRWEDVECVQAWHDGSRVVIDRNGGGVVVENGRWQESGSARDEIDRRTDAARRVVVGPRYGQPPAPAAPTRGVRMLLGVRRVVWLALAVSIVVAAAAAVTKPGVATIAAAIAAVAAWVGFCVVTSRSPAPFVWDLGDRRSSVPDDLDPKVVGTIPGGLLVGWLARRRLLAAHVETQFADDLAEFRAEAITGPELYRRLGALLCDDLLVAEANEFFTDYLGQRHRGFDVDLLKTLPASSVFNIADSRSSQQKIDPVLDERFAAWQRWWQLPLVGYLRRFPGAQDNTPRGQFVWRGAQADRPVHDLVNWFRHRFW